MRTITIFVCAALASASIGHAAPLEIRRPIPRSKKTIAGLALLGFGVAAFAATVGTAADGTLEHLGCSFVSDPKPGECAGVGSTLFNAAIGTGVASAVLLATAVPLLAIGGREERAARAKQPSFAFGVAPIVGAQGAAGFTLSIGGRF